MNKNKVLNTITEEIGERTIRFRISTETVDRDGDILISKGCDFTNYDKNPVFLSFHDYHEYPLGKVVKYWSEEKAVYADVYFPTVEELCTDKETASEKAKIVDFTYHCYKNGMLNAVSVGFASNDWEENKATGGVIFKKWELLEFSAVTVPANQDAIATARKSFNLDIEPEEKYLTVEESTIEIELTEEKTIDIM